MSGTLPMQRLLLNAVAVAALLGAPLLGVCQDAVSSSQARRPFMPPASMAEAFIPDFLRRDLQVLSDHFALGDDQQTIVESLFNEYEQKFQQGGQRLREAIQDMQPTREQREQLQMHNYSAMERRLEDLVDRMREIQDFDEDNSEPQIERLKDEARQIREQMQQGDAAAMQMELLRQIMRDVDVAVAEWDVEKQALYDEFLDNVQVVLSDEQKQLWPAFERRMRRIKTLSKGALSGESTDVLALIRALDLSREQSALIQPVLETFELELDSALKARNEHLRDTRMQRAAILQQGDQQAAEKLMSTELAYRIAVRTVNETGANSVSDQLGGDPGAELLERFRKQSYAKVYRRTRASRAFDAMRQVPELDPDIVDSLNALVIVYEQQLATDRQRMIEQVRQYEPEQLRRRYVVQVARIAGQEPLVSDDNPLHEAFAAQNQTDQRYIESGLGFLDEHQIMGLPAFVRMGTPWAELVQPSEEAPPQTQQEKLDFASQFDTNGDGQLDAVERDKLRRALQELYRKQSKPQEQADD